MKCACGLYFENTKLKSSYDISQLCNLILVGFYFTIVFIILYLVHVIILVGGRGAEFRIHPLPFTL